MGWGRCCSAFKQLIIEEERHIHFIEGILSNRERVVGSTSLIEKIGLLKPTDYFDERAIRVSAAMLRRHDGPEVTIFNTAG